MPFLDEGNAANKQGIDRGQKQDVQPVADN